MAAAQNKLHAAMIYVLAVTLCLMYTGDTVVVAYSYRFVASNPPSSKLLFLAELLKLVLSGLLLLAEKYSKRDSQQDQQQSVKSQLLPHADAPADAQPAVKRSPRAVQLLAALQALLMFAVPAVCYFITNNLSFLSLKLISAHTYTMLCDLKVITTCGLSYLVLDKHLNAQAVISLTVLFVGICTGQYATLTTDEAATGSATAASPANNLWQGILLMCCVAVLSAVAAVFTEWVMNRSPDYKQESLNLQNMRLYASGTLLNGLLCVYSKTSLVSLANMRATHWVNVACLAFMGLATAVIIKRFGNIVKVYASCVASLFAAGISYSLLHDPPAPLFYAGCALVMVATLQLQRARRTQGEVAACSSATSSAVKGNNSAKGSSYS